LDRSAATWASKQAITCVRSRVLPSRECTDGGEPACLSEAGEAAEKETKRKVDSSTNAGMRRCVDDQNPTWKPWLPNGEHIEDNLPPWAEQAWR